MIVDDCFVSIHNGRGQLCRAMPGCNARVPRIKILIEATVAYIYTRENVTLKSPVWSPFMLAQLYNMYHHTVYMYVTVSEKMWHSAQNVHLSYK